MAWIKRIISYLQVTTWKIACLVIGVVLLGLFISAFRSRSALDYEDWNKRRPDGEFDAKLLGVTVSFADYLKIEEKVFSQLSSYFIKPSNLSGRSAFGRYIKNSHLNPSTYQQNYNQTYELRPKNIKGGVLLLHGLSDSPYSMRSLGDVFYRSGYYVLNLRLPGHGVVPSGLLNVSWFDWSEAVNIGARQVSEVVGAEKPFLIAGYSNGGALALYYTTNAMITGSRRVPDRLFLFSPAVGISALARASNWHKLFSWIPAFEKNKWLTLQPEYDPYKFNSFAKNGGAMTKYLSLAVKTNIGILKSTKQMKEFPPVLTFQSVVDSTIVSEAVISKLYNQLENNGSEIVLFDINHAEGLDSFFLKNPRHALEKLERDDTLSYSLSVITNEDKKIDVIAREKGPFENKVIDRPLHLRWPEQVFSLSHVAIPFSPNDPLYGDSKDTPRQGLTLGSLAPRGERGVLRISTDQLMRLRYNPFYSYMQEKIQSVLER